MVVGTPTRKILFVAAQYDRCTDIASTLLTNYCGHAKEQKVLRRRRHRSLVSAKRFLTFDIDVREGDMEVRCGMLKRSMKQKC
jgi:hypothetical protein